MRFGRLGRKKRKRAKEIHQGKEGWIPNKNRTREGRNEAIERLRIPVYQRDGFKCRCRGCRKCSKLKFWSKFCGRGPPGLNIDHIMPVSEGGPDIAENLQTLCKKCNQEKGNKWKDRGHAFRDYSE